MISSSIFEDKNVGKRFSAIFKSTSSLANDDSLNTCLALAFLNKDFLFKNLKELSVNEKILQSSQMKIAKLMAESKSVGALLAKISESGKCSKHTCYTALKISQEALSELVGLNALISLAEVEEISDEESRSEAQEIISINSKLGAEEGLNDKISSYFIGKLNLSN